METPQPESPNSLEEPHPRFGSEQPGQHDQAPDSSDESDADFDDRDYRPGAIGIPSATAEETRAAIRFQLEVKDGIAEAESELVDLRFNGPYGSRGYGVFKGKIGFVPYVEGRYDDFMSSLSNYKADVEDPTQPELAFQQMELFQRDIRRLVDRLFKDEHEEKTLHPNQATTFKKQGVLILLTMSKEIVQSIIKGDLPHVPFTPEQDRPQAKRVLRQYQVEREGMTLEDTFQPAIYAQYLCCDDGRGPKSETLRAIMDRVEQYIDDGEYASLVDIQVGSPSPIAVDALGNTNRRYLKTGETRERRISRLREFVEAVRNRLPEDPTVRPRCIAAYGYTNNFKKRLDLHCKHEQSNFILNLVDAICRKDFPACRISQHVVFSCWMPQQGWVAEMLINRLGMGYASSGYGFSYHPTGRSNASAAGYTSVDYDRWAIAAELYTPLIVQGEERKSLKKDANTKFQTEVLDVLKEDELKEREKDIRLRADIDEAKATMVRWAKIDKEAIKEANDVIAEGTTKNPLLRKLAEAVAMHGEWLDKDNADTEG